MQRIIIFANGEIPEINQARRLLQPGDYIICADGGTHHALAMDVKPDLIIGDMDSVDNSQLNLLREEGVAIELFPSDKNETDLELAINHAVDMRPERIVIVAALGGRLDQTLGNITLLADPRLAMVDVRLDDGVEESLICRNQAQIRGRSGDTISLIPWQGAVSGIQTKGLKWSLHDESLYPEKTRGISNEMTGEAASISIRSGLLLIIHRRA